LATDEWEKIHAVKNWGKFPLTDLERILTTLHFDVPNPKILDLGCGNGSSIWLIRSSKFTNDIHGIDISPSAVIKTREFLQQVGYLEVPVVVGNMAALPYDDNTFDMLLDICSTQNASGEDLDTIYKEVHRVLKPNHLFVSLYRGIDNWPECNKIVINPKSATELIEIMKPYFNIMSLDTTLQTAFNGEYSLLHNVVLATNNKGERN
jgi:ubiquinone/menaquinone biosynthesis C-methylase UbiE